ncbi:MAG: molybdopterin-dependent oxidoreductase [Porticoccaceae bacterium]
MIQIAANCRQRRQDRGKSMVIVGAAMNHWYHMDMNYRGLINMLIMCGCVGQSGGGWAHYVGQEKLRPQTGWLPLAFGLDWHRPPRHMNSTSFFYNHSSQWRHRRSVFTTCCHPSPTSQNTRNICSTTTSGRAHGLVAISTPAEP